MMKNFRSILIVLVFMMVKGFRKHYPKIWYLNIWAKLKESEKEQMQDGLPTFLFSPEVHHKTLMWEMTSHNTNGHAYSKHGEIPKEIPKNGPGWLYPSFLPYPISPLSYHLSLFLNLSIKTFRFNHFFKY